MQMIQNGILYKHSSLNSRCTPLHQSVRHRRTLKKDARAPTTAANEPQYLFGTNKAAKDFVPKNWFERSLYDFYFKVPAKSEWEVQLQTMADDKFKGLRNWKKIHTELRARRVKSLAPTLAAAAAGPGPRQRRRGSNSASGGGASSSGGGGPLKLELPFELPFGRPRPVLLDVRERAKFVAAHAAGAVNVPLYSEMTAPADAFDRIRSVYFALFGLRAPMRNAAFAEEVAAAVGGRRVPILVMCETGGTLETAAERKQRDPRLPAPIYGEFGAASRSLFAAHELLTEGAFADVRHVAGGFAQWRADGLALAEDDGEYEAITIVMSS